jgi:hypothetical protein
MSLNINLIFFVKLSCNIIFSIFRQKQLSSIDLTTKHDYRYLIYSSIISPYSVDLYDILIK